MPRKGPKKFTRRDETEQERKSAKARFQAAQNKAENCEKALRQYQEKHNPNIPSSKGERRALKAALAAEGISLERWNGGPLDERFAHIAQERFVNNKYALPSEDLEEIDVECDPWLQMFLHLPADYREQVEEIAPQAVTGGISPTVPQPRQERKKMSRRQAQALKQAENSPAREEGVASTDQENSSADSYDEVEIAETAHALTPEASLATVPTGQVTITNAKNMLLIADPAGRVSFSAHTQPDNGWEKWTIAAGKNGKYTLRSAHGKFLSHCLLWGFVADRVVADAWEEFQLISVPESAVAGNDGNDNVFSVLSWRGMYLTDTMEATKNVKEGHGFRISIV